MTTTSPPKHFDIQCSLFNIRYPLPPFTPSTRLAAVATAAFRNFEPVACATGLHTLFLMIRGLTHTPFSPLPPTRQNTIPAPMLYDRDSLPSPLSIEDPELASGINQKNYDGLRGLSMAPLSLV